MAIGFLDLPYVLPGKSGAEERNSKQQSESGLFLTLSAAHASDASAVERRPATSKTQKGNAGNRHIRMELSKIMPKHCFTEKTAKISTIFQKDQQNSPEDPLANKGEKDWHEICRLTLCADSAADIRLDGVAWHGVPPNNTAISARMQ